MAVVQPSLAVASVDDIGHCQLSDSGIEMESGMSLRTALKLGTRDSHDTVDAIFDRFDLADSNDYRAFLIAHARAIVAWEEVLEAAGIEALLPDWPERRRRTLLAEDLQQLGLPMPASLTCAPVTGASALWGAAYVLEGSKFGGLVLSRRVPEALPTRYLRSQGPKGSLKQFMDRLDTAADVDEAAAIATARAVFDSFRTAAEIKRQPVETAP